MKASSSIPVRPTLNLILASPCEEKRISIPGESKIHLRPVEIKRFIHNLREIRQLICTNDFVF